MTRRVAGELVLVPANSRTSDPKYRAANLFVLNRTGEHLWELLAAPQTSEALARNLMISYDLSDDEARRDTAAFVAEMLAIGAIQRPEE